MIVTDPAVLVLSFNNLIKISISISEKGGDRFLSPVDAFLKVISFMAGEIEFDATFLGSIVVIQGI